MADRESELYVPIKGFLDQHFSKSGKKHYFEITAKTISNKIKNEFDSNLLLLLQTERTLPDIMGFVEKGDLNELFVFEIKDEKPTIKAIYQLKKYAEVLNAKYAYLICTKEISAELRKCLENVPSIQSYNAGYGGISIIHFDEKTKQIIPKFSFFRYDDELNPNNKT